MEQATNYNRNTYQQGSVATDRVNPNSMLLSRKTAKLLLQLPVDRRSEMMHLLSYVAKRKDTSAPLAHRVHGKIRLTTEKGQPRIRGAGGQSQNVLATDVVQQLRKTLTLSSRRRPPPPPAYNAPNVVALPWQKTIETKHVPNPVGEGFRMFNEILQPLLGIALLANPVGAAAKLATGVAATSIAASSAARIAATVPKSAPVATRTETRLATPRQPIAKLPAIPAFKPRPQPVVQALEKHLNKIDRAIKLVEDVQQLGVQGLAQKYATDALANLDAKLLQQLEKRVISSEAVAGAQRVTDVVASVRDARPADAIIAAKKLVPQAAKVQLDAITKNILPIRGSRLIDVMRYR